MSLTKLQVKTFFWLVNPKLFLSLIGCCLLQEYLNHSYWIPHELILRIIIRWISLDQPRREEYFVQLFHNVDEQVASDWLTTYNYTNLWLVDLQTVAPFVQNSLEKEEKELYQLLQDRFLPEPDYQEIEQELEDQTSFLSIAFSAVKVSYSFFWLVDTK